MTSDTIDCDVLVVGGGMAGLVAASRAAELGGEVLLLDKGSNVLGDGNTLMTSGLYYTGGVSWRSTPSDLYNRATDSGVAFPELAAAWANNCARALNWLENAKVEVDYRAEGEPQLEPRSQVSTGPVYKTDVGANIIKKLQAFFEANHGRSMSRTRAVKLLTKRGNVVGVEAVRSTSKKLTILGGATVLATGGYQASGELLRKFVGHHADSCKLMGSMASTGDGLKMTLAVGAKVVNLRYFYGKMLCLSAIRDDRFWPYPTMDTLVEDGILVDRSGRRFCDEGWGDVPIANLVATWDDATAATLIFGQEAWERSKGDVNSLVAPNPWLIEKGGQICQAASLAELAGKLGIDSERLENTVEEFNNAAKRRRLGELGVPRINNTWPLNPPFYGVRMVPGIVSTMGGPLINKRANVLNKKDEPIPGLYAAGDLVGGLMGGRQRGYMGGISQATVTGLLAGENAYKHFLERGS